MLENRNKLKLIVFKQDCVSVRIPDEWFSSSGLPYTSKNTVFAVLQDGFVRLGRYAARNRRRKAIFGPLQRRFTPCKLSETRDPRLAGDTILKLYMEQYGNDLHVDISYTWICLLTVDKKQLLETIPTLIKGPAMHIRYCSHAYSFS